MNLLSATWAATACLAYLYEHRKPCDEPGLFQEAIDWTMSTIKQGKKEEEEEEEGGCAWPALKLHLHGPSPLALLGRRYGQPKSR